MQLDRIEIMLGDGDEPHTRVTLFPEGGLETCYIDQADPYRTWTLKHSLLTDDQIATILAACAPLLDNARDHFPATIRDVLRDMHNDEFAWEPAEILAREG